MTEEKSETLDEILDEILEETGGPLTEAEIEWARQVLGPDLSRD